MVAEFKPFSLSETLKVNETLSSKVASYHEALKLRDVVAALEDVKKNNDSEARLRCFETASELVKLRELMKTQECGWESVAIAAKSQTSLSNAVESLKKKFYWSKDSAKIEHALKAYKLNKELLRWADLEMQKMDHLKFSLSDMKIAADLANKKLTSGT